MLDAITNADKKQDSNGYRKPWADFVHAVLDGTVLDTICCELLKDAKVVRRGSDDYDFIIRASAMQKIYQQHMPAIQLRFADVMQKMTHEANDDE